MSESNWDFFFYRRNDPHPVSAYTDLAADTDAAKAARPLLLTIDVQMKDPRPDGLSSQQESDTLFQLEDAWMAKLDSRPNAQFVGRITERGHRVWYFYLKSGADCESFIDAVCKAADYSAIIQIGQDPKWSTYGMVLVPNPTEFREIQDRRVLTALRENGDDLSQPRGIQHWAYFPTEGARDRYITTARSRGFACRPTEGDPKVQPGKPFGATCHRVDPVRPPMIHNVVSELTQLAADQDGEYDGWECQVVKPGSTPLEDRPKDAH
jgi:uncharacterized protein (TIGR01619 family)